MADWQLGQFPQKLDWQSIILKDGVFDGLNVTPGTGLTVDVASGFAMIDGRPYRKTSSTNISLDPADATNPRKDLIYFKNDNTINKITGTPEAALPNTQTGVFTIKPRPPSLPSNSIPLAEVWVAANATSLTSGDIFDRRRILPWSYAIDKFYVHNKNISSFFSGIGTESTSGSASVVYGGENVILKTGTTSGSYAELVFSVPPLKAFESCKFEILFYLSANTNQNIAMFIGDDGDWLSNYPSFPVEVNYSNVGFVIIDDKLYGTLGKNTSAGLDIYLCTLSSNTYYYLKAVYYKDKGARYYVNNEFKDSITNSAYFPESWNVFPYLYIKNTAAANKAIYIYSIEARQTTL